LGIAALMNFTAYFLSDKIVLAMYRAREVSEWEAPELHDIVDRLAQKGRHPETESLHHPDPKRLTPSQQGAIPTMQPLR